MFIVDEAGGSIRGSAGKAGFNDQIPNWCATANGFTSDRGDRPIRNWRAPAAGQEAQQLTTTGGTARSSHGMVGRCIT